MYGTSRSWIYELLARYRDEGGTAYQPRPRRRRPTRTRHHPRPSTTAPAEPASCSSNLDLRVISAITGELLRELKIDPSKDYQPRTPKRKTPEPTFP